jgi:hypothetical protein
MFWLSLIGDNLEQYEFCEVFFGLLLINFPQEIKILSVQNPFILFESIQCIFKAL